ncbi:MAG TPA: AraC family transcriptional regulator [Usitatibacter sp.]|nr:AraC family transcriptional regulator [Usitatibacter sp.]
MTLLDYSWQALSTMIATPDELIEKPALRGKAEPPDLLSEVLAHVRLSGAIFLRGEYAAPWAFDSPESHELAAVLAPGAKRLILFHIVREGRCWVSAKGERVELAAGDVAVLPFADRHLMGSPGCDKAVPIAELLPPPPWSGVPTCRFDGGGENTGVVCGYLKCDELLFNPALRMLPALFRVRPRPGPGAQWMQACVQYALEETAHRRPGGADLMSRLPELLFIEALRLYAQSVDANARGWLAAMKDPVVSHALAHLHAQPAHKWTVTELATRSFTSRSVLDERFRRLLGCSPIRYLTEWRLQLAADLLRGNRLKLAAVAERVGYESEAAFSRAFRRHAGCSPARWRGEIGRH